MNGIELSRQFYIQIIRPWLGQVFPRLQHAAALLGYGSELLGLDDEISHDHNWGPRVWLYVTEADFSDCAENIVASFADIAPNMFLGVPIGFYSRPNAVSQGTGVRGDLRHGLEVWTLKAALDATLGLNPGEPCDNLTWLSLPEQKLLAMTAGAVFHDDDGELTALRAKLAYYPDDVWLFKLASQWAHIAEECAFVGRAGAAGDEIGSQVIAARTVRGIMRLAFLLERQYAPYPKWFGSAFTRLKCADALAPLLASALSAQDWRLREATLGQASELVGRLHQASGAPGHFEPKIASYFGRPFHVINADEIAKAIQAEIRDPRFSRLPLIGSIDQITDSTPLVEAPRHSRRIIEALYGGGMQQVWNI